MAAANPRKLFANIVVRDLTCGSRADPKALA